jgi:ABC-type phosphate transport system permease subunit
VGNFIDGGPANAGWPVLPAGQWYLVLALLLVVSVAAFLLGVVGASKPGATATRGKRILSIASTICWIAAVSVLAALIVTTPYFRGFYEASLPNPTFGKGGVLWASLTLALLTLPVVIVATEEALAAVPNSMREGSYGCGASKWQTIRNIVLPHALPGIMTGMILAMARGAGEVAPLMLVGAVKFAPELPLQMSDWSGSIGPLLTGPLHADRSFMHLGFHIYDLGFQSQDSEAAKPMVFTTTLLLILIIATLNIGAIWLRTKLRRRFQAGQF